MNVVRFVPATTLVVSGNDLIIIFNLKSRNYLKKILVGYIANYKTNYVYNYGNFDILT